MLLFAKSKDMPALVNTQIETLCHSAWPLVEYISVSIDLGTLLLLMIFCLLN